MITVTVSIGRNVGTVAMPAVRWAQFHARIHSAFTVSGAFVFVSAARSVGEWDGVREDSATWVASMPAEHLLAFRDALAVIAGAFRQDAIALTVGNTELVAPERTPRHAHN